MVEPRPRAAATFRGVGIEIQGDHRDLLLGELAARGWTVKRSAG